MYLKRILDNLNLDPQSATPKKIAREIKVMAESTNLCHNKT